MSKYNDLVNIIEQIASQTGAMTDSKRAEANEKLALILGDIGSPSVSSSTTEILTEYPTTDASKAGQQFIYKGRLWMYHTQAMLNDLGWTTVSEGFPAPVEKIYDHHLLYPKISVTNYQYNDYSLFPAKMNDFSFDILGFGNPVLINQFSKGPGDGGIVGNIKNANLLLSLEDRGTAVACNLVGQGLITSQVDDFFTQLPPTTKTATIDIRGNTGAAGFDSSIATDKGYTILS